MKKLFFILIILIFSNIAYGQCVCGKLRFAIDDDTSKYQYFVKIKNDKFRVKFHDYANQSHIHLADSKKSLFKHHSYKTYNKEKNEIETKTFDKKYFVLLNIDPGKRNFTIEILNKKSKEKMEINFSKNTVDVSYNVLTDFVSGKFKVDLTELKSTFQSNYENEKILYKDSELKAIASDSRKSSGNDWIKIMDMKKFKK